MKAEAYGKSALFEKAVRQRIRELREFFGITDGQNKIVSNALELTARASVSLMRLERLLEKAPPGDPAFSYSYLERDRADRKFRSRFADLEKLTGKTVVRMKQGDGLFKLRARFGFYVIDNEFHMHWKYLLAQGFGKGFPKRVPSGAKRIHGEYFLPPKVYQKLNEDYNAYCDRLSEPEQEALQEKMNEAHRNRKYVPLPVEWRSRFQKKSTVKSLEIVFNDPLPASDASIKAEKSIRNALDYKHRKARPKRNRMEHAMYET